VGIIAVLAVVAYVLTYTHYLEMHQYPVVRSDGIGYYAYLPAWLVDGDPSMRHLVAVDLPGQRLDWLGFTLEPSTHAYLDRYPIGEAVLLLPFFGLGHIASHVLGYDANGFSAPEQLASGLGGLVYMIAGFAVLALVLQRHFSRWVTVVVLTGITFGSNLFHYATFDSMFSHAFSFFLVALLLETTHRFYQRPESKLGALALGGNLGMIVLVRTSNIIFVLFPLLYGVTDRTSLRARALLLKDHVGSGVLVSAVAAVLLAPQLAVWHIATGQWYVYSYAGYDLTSYIRT